MNPVENPRPIRGVSEVIQEWLLHISVRVQSEGFEDIAHLLSNSRPDAMERRLLKEISVLIARNATQDTADRLVPVMLDPLIQYAILKRWLSQQNFGNGFLILSDALFISENEEALGLKGAFQADIKALLQYTLSLVDDQLKIENLGFIQTLDGWLKDHISLLSADEQTSIEQALREAVTRSIAAPIAANAAGLEPDPGVAKQPPGEVIWQGNGISFRTVPETAVKTPTEPSKYEQLKQKRGHKRGKTSTSAVAVVAEKTLLQVFETDDLNALKSVWLKDLITKKTKLKNAIILCLESTKGRYASHCLLCLLKESKLDDLLSLSNKQFNRCKALISEISDKAFFDEFVAIQTKKPDAAAVDRPGTERVKLAESEAIARARENLVRQIPDFVAKALEDPELLSHDMLLARVTARYKAELGLKEEGKLNEKLTKQIKSVVDVQWQKHDAVHRTAVAEKAAADRQQRQAERRKQELQRKQEQALKDILKRTPQKVLEVLNSPEVIGTVDEQVEIVLGVLLTGEMELLKSAVEQIKQAVKKEIEKQLVSAAAPKSVEEVSSLLTVKAAEAPVIAAPLSDASSKEDTGFSVVERTALLVEPTEIKKSPKPVVTFAQYKPEKPRISAVTTEPRRLPDHAPELFRGRLFMTRPVDVPPAELRFEKRKLIYDEKTQCIGSVMFESFAAGALVPDLKCLSNGGKNIVACVQVLKDTGEEGSSIVVNDCVFSVCESQRYFTGDRILAFKGQAALLNVTEFPEHGVRAFLSFDPGQQPLSSVMLYIEGEIVDGRQSFHGFTTTLTQFINLRNCVYCFQEKAELLSSMRP